MRKELEQLKKLLSEYGELIESSRSRISVKSTACIDKEIPSTSGVYWIETNMPVEELRLAITEVVGKEKKLRKTPPKGTKLISQKSSEMYVVYSGTEDDLKKRLKQHLFNQGHADTVKLGCVIDEEPFSTYTWHVSIAEIPSYELRYAIEAWWRLNKGWPVFCLR